MVKKRHRYLVKLHDFENVCIVQIQSEFVVLKFVCSLLARLIDFSCHIPLQSILTLYSTACELLLRHNPLRFVLNNHFRNQNVLSKTPLQELLPCCSTLHGGKHSQAGTVLTQECCTVMHGFYKSDLMARFMEIMLHGSKDGFARSSWHGSWHCGQVLV